MLSIPRLTALAAASLLLLLSKASPLSDPRLRDAGLLQSAQLLEATAGRNHATLQARTFEPMEDNETQAEENARILDKIEAIWNGVEAARKSMAVTDLGTLKKSLNSNYINLGKAKQRENFWLVTSYNGANARYPNAFAGFYLVEVTPGDALAHSETLQFKKTKVRLYEPGPREFGGLVAGVQFAREMNVWDAACFKDGPLKIEGWIPYGELLDELTEFTTPQEVHGEGGPSLGTQSYKFLMEMLKKSGGFVSLS
ncbi:MAG: hypothetical protein M1829_003224 [Trizodia sp. TS-e1964]|nr:MAG: hypothetical protein M1829_003224 [Trizodia sp. TS-e1964]